MKYLLGDSIEEMEAHRRLLQQAEALEDRAWADSRRKMEKRMKTMTKTEEVFTKINSGVDFRNEPPVTVLFQNGSITVEKNTFHFLNEWYEFSEDGNKALSVLKRWSRLRESHRARKSTEQELMSMFPMFFAGYMSTLDGVDVSVRYDAIGVNVSGLPPHALPRNIDGQPGSTDGDTRTEGSNSLLQHVLQFVHFTYDYKEYVVVKIGTADLVVLESNGRSDDEIFNFSHANIGCTDCEWHLRTDDGGYTWTEWESNEVKFEFKGLQQGSNWENGKLCYLTWNVPRTELDQLGINVSDGDIDEFDGEVLLAGTLLCPCCSGIVRGTP